jgi:hypothetical protein
MTAESEDPRALIETPLQQSRGSALFVKIRLIRGLKKSKPVRLWFRRTCPDARLWLNFSS